MFTCICVTAKSTVKKCFPEDVAEQNLIVSNTEAPGEEVMVNQFSLCFVWWFNDDSWLLCKIVIIITANAYWALITPSRAPSALHVLIHLNFNSIVLVS